MTSRCVRVSLHVCVGLVCQRPAVCSLSQCRAVRLGAFYGYCVEDCRLISINDIATDKTIDTNLLMINVPAQREASLV